MEAREAQYHGIGQAPQNVDMRELLEGELVTYLGTYRVRGSHPLRFRVDLQVTGERALEVAFDDHEPRR